MAVLFTEVQNWEQPRCPSAGDWLKTLIHLDHGLLLWDKEKQLLTQVTTLMLLHGIVLSEKAKDQKVTCCMMLFIHSILEMTKLSRWKASEWWPGFSGETDGNRRKVEAVIKHSHEVSSSWRNSASLDCGGGYRNLHKWWICIELNTHKNPSQTGEVRKTGELYQWQWYSTCDIIQ